MLKLIKITIFLFIIFCFVLPIDVFATDTSLINAKVIMLGDTFLKVETDIGERITVDQLEGSESGRFQFHEGDKLVISKIEMQDGGSQYMIVDYVRRPWVYLLFAVFVAVVLFVCGKYGFRSLINLGVTLLVIFFNNNSLNFERLESSSGYGCWCTFGNDI